MAETKTIDLNATLKRFDLKDEILKPSEDKEIFVATPKPVNEFVGDDDFDQDIISDILKSDNDDEEENIDPADGLTDISGEEFSEIGTQAFDLIITLSSTLAYSKTKLTKEQRQRRDELIAELNSPVSSREKISKTDKWILMQDKKIELYRDKKAPLTEKEGKRFEKALAKVLAQKNIKVSPGAGLVVASLSIALPRAIDVFANLLDRDHPPYEDPIVEETKERVNLNDSE